MINEELEKSLHSIGQDGNYHILDDLPDEVQKNNNPIYSVKYDYLFRICMVGDAGVGKTSLLIRYCDGSFKDSYSSTIGVDFRIISLDYQNKKIKLNFSDTAGQERFKAISSKYFRSSHGFFFVYDVNSRESFRNIKNWIASTEEYNDHNVINFLIGNKIDLGKREVSVEEGIDFSKDNKMLFIETSAKDNSNVNEAFCYITKALVKHFTSIKNSYDKIKCDDDSKNENKKYERIDIIKEKKSSCC